MGVATAESPTRGLIFVARYNPRGNVESSNSDEDAEEYEDNVRPEGINNPILYYKSYHLNKRLSHWTI